MQDQYGRLLPTLFDAAATAGWRRGMIAVTLALLDCQAGKSAPPAPVLELGCGRGDLLATLAQYGGSGPLLGVDLHPAALVAATAEAGIGFARADAQAAPVADGSIATLFALDLLDQRGVDPARLLAECRRVLQLEGRLIVRVSAHPQIYGPHDVAFNTAQRFTPGALTHMLGQAGFQVERCTYADSLLMGPVATLRLLQRWGWLALDRELYRAQWANRLIAVTLGLEARWLRRRNLATGLSLLAVARRQQAEC